MTGERARLGRDAFLQSPSPAQTDHVLIENLVLIGVETRRRHFRRHAMPTELPTPWPNGPVVHSTPGVSTNSGWPGVLECNCRNRLISDIGKS